jgi:hypothetical protein
MLIPMAVALYLRRMMIDVANEYLWCWIDPHRQKPLQQVMFLMRDYRHLPIILKML